MSADFEEHVRADGSVLTRTRPVWLAEGSRLVFANTCATGGEERYLLVMSDPVMAPERAVGPSELVYDVHVCAERHLYDNDEPPTEPWMVHAGEFATGAWPAADGRFMLATGPGLWVDYC